MSDACAMMSEIKYEVETFTIDSMIRGYYVYKDVRLNFIAEVLYSCLSLVMSNHQNPFAVMMCS